MAIQQRIREKLTLLAAKRPSETVLLAILVLNLIFFLIATLVIYFLSPVEQQDQGIAATLFYTISMVLDAGCISYIVTDAHQAGAALIVFCLTVVLLGMVFFTGSIIGYVTNFISTFVEKAGKGSYPLHVSGHTVIIGWNARACEIIASALYEEDEVNIIVLSEHPKEEVEAEIKMRLTEVVNKNRAPHGSSEINKRRRISRKNVSYVVRQGDVQSTIDLNNICINEAKTVYIMSDQPDLGPDDSLSQGNASLIKTLIQVAEAVKADESADAQCVVVEVEDRWTEKIAREIAGQKLIVEKCNFIIVSSYELMGSLIAKFAICPELNNVYDDLFSIEGAHLISRKSRFEAGKQGKDEFVKESLMKNRCVLPLTVLNSEYGPHEYFLVESDGDAGNSEDAKMPALLCSLNPRSGLEARKVIILGGNKSTPSIMGSLSNLQQEWGKLIGSETIEVVVFDDAERNGQFADYQNYDLETKAIDAGLFDDKKFEKELYREIFETSGRVTLLVLSDDVLAGQETDAGAIARVVFVHNVLERIQAIDARRMQDIDLMVEVQEQSSIDLIKSFGVDNIIVSSRYLSTIMSQVGAHESLLALYSQILSSNNSLIDGSGSIEVYTRKAARFFAELPGKCTAEQLVRGVYESSSALEGRSPTIVLGYFNAVAGLRLFTGDQSRIQLQLQPDDILVLFANH